LSGQPYVAARSRCRRGGFNRKVHKGRKEEGTHHEGTKDTKGSDIYTLKLRELRAFVVKIFLFRRNFNCSYAALVPLWLIFLR